MAFTASEPAWDVFVSYPRADRDAVEPLVEVLQGNGLRVFLDESDIPGFTSVTDQIRSAIARSHLLLAYLSRDYLGRKACRWELKYALRVGYLEGNPFGRFLVVNPEEPDRDHFLYPELRGTKIWPPPDTPLRAKQLVDDIGDRLAQLPGPMRRPAGSGRFPSPTGFTGRDLEIFEINARIGLNAHQRIEALNGSPGPRTALIVGSPGMGKSALIAEYLHQFGEFFDGGVHRYSGEVPNHHPDGLVVIEDLVTRQSREVREWLAGQPGSCAAILSSRRHLHIPANPLMLSGLDRDSTLALLAAYKPPLSRESREATRLAEAIGGHPQTAHVVGHLLQTFTSAPYAHANREWHRLDRDVIAESARRMRRLWDGYSADFVSRLSEALPPEGSAALTVLRALTVMPSAADHPELLAHILTRHGHAEVPSDALKTLERRGLVFDGRLLPTVARVVERHDPGPVERSNVARSVRAAYDGHVRTVRHMRPRGSMPTDQEIEIAYNLQVELSLRVTTRQLPDEQGILSEALSSLKDVLKLTRDSLKELGPEGQNGEVAELMNKLCDTLTDFLTEWHPRLQDHNSVRPSGVGEYTHENNWEYAARLREELPVLQRSIGEILNRLRRITGSEAV